MEVDFKLTYKCCGCHWASWHASSFWQAHFRDRAKLAWNSSLTDCAVSQGKTVSKIKDPRNLFHCRIFSSLRSKAKRASISRAQESHLDCFNEAAASDGKWVLGHLAEKIMKALKNAPSSDGKKLELKDVEQRATPSTCQCHDTTSGNQYLSFHTTHSAFHHHHQQTDYHQVANASNPTLTSEPSDCSNQKRLQNQGTSEAVFQISSRLPFNVSEI